MTVHLCSQIDINHLRELLGRYGLDVRTVAADEAIPGSFWQPPEAGLVGDMLYVRDDTPVHSALHEACHYICMDSARRDALHTDAGGGYEEEDGVCYLQILLAGLIPGMSRERMFDDMDAWGYSFRLGSSRAWFERDAEDAAGWLLRHGLISNGGEPSWLKRMN